MKKILSSALIFAAFLGCSKIKSQHSTTSGIIGTDDSVTDPEKPNFADLLSHKVKGGYSISCNGVKLSDGRFLTAAHCLENHADSKNVLLRGNKIVTSLAQVGAYDLAVGDVIGGAAPSERIKLFQGTLPSTFTLESTWYDVRRNEWRHSSGHAIVDGAYIRHDLDTLPGASGSALYLVNEQGEKLLVGIHLGFNREANVNVGLLLSKAFDKNFTETGSDITHNLETELQDSSHGTLTCSKSTGECVLVMDGNGDGDGGGGEGSGQDGDGNSGDGNGGDSGGGSDNGGSGGEGSGGEGGSGNDGEGGGGRGGNGGEGYPPIIVNPDKTTGDGDSNGGGGQSAEAKDCFNCDIVWGELNKNDLFRQDCDNAGSNDSPNVGLMLAPGSGPAVDLGKPDEQLREFKFNPSNSQFTQSLKDFAQKLIDTTKWETVPTLSQKMGALSADALAKMREWTEKVVRNLDDYYALLVSTVKSDELQSPTLPKIDVTQEGIDSAQKYLDAVKEQILKNPDQYQKARLEIADSGTRAFTLAKEALGNGDIETAEAAVEIGRALTDAALGFAPGVSWLKDVVEATTGYNFITKQDLTRIELVSAWIGVFSAGYGSKVLGIAKAGAIIGVVGKISKSSKLAARLEEAGLKAKQIYEAASRAGLKDRKRIGEVFDAVKRRLPGAKAEQLEEEITSAFKRYENLPLINGAKPRNGHFAGNTYYEGLSEKLKVKYPDGVKFNEKGFPDFSPYAMKFENGKTSVVIDAGLTPAADFKAANKAADLAKKPKDYTWHHHQDSGVMELIPTDLHSAVGHTGGWTIWGGGVKL